MRVCISRVVFQLEVSEEMVRERMGRIERMRGCEDVRMKRRGCMTHNTGFTPIYIVNKFNFKPLWIKDRSKVSPTYIFNKTKTLLFYDNKNYAMLFIYLISEMRLKISIHGGKRLIFPPSLPRILSFKIGEGYIPTVESFILCD